MTMLRDLRKKVKKLEITIYLFFKILRWDMALKYPISIDELSNVHGVGEESKKNGKPFVDLIQSICRRK